MLRRITSCLTLIGLLFGSLAPIAIFAAPPNQQNQQRRGHKVSPELESATTSTRTLRVIIQTKGRPSTAHDSAIGNRGGAKRKQFEALNTIVAEVPINTLADLAARDDIEYISPDRPVRAQMSVTREAVGADQVQAGAPGVPAGNGRGIGIAIIDSGISATHPDFQKNGHSRVVASVDFTDSGSPQINAVGDRAGHGTGVAGVAAGNGAASRGYAGNYSGIAPEANLIDLKVLDENGSGHTSSTLEAINWAITNQRRFNIRVINLSLGTPARESFRTDPLCRAVERAVVAGIVVVGSAGNSGRTDEIVSYDSNGDPIYRQVFGGVNSPGMSPYAITVGATDSHSTVKRSDDTVATFSSKGPTRFDHLAKPDVVAPGRRIAAPMSQENPTFGVQYPDRIVQPTGARARPYAYFSYSGTSFAAPVVSGIVALMLQTNKSLTPALVKAVLARSAQALPASQFQSKAQSVLSQGVGEVNAASAVEMARAIVPNADKLKAGDPLFRPRLSLSSLSQTVVIGGEAVEPSSRVLYADGVIFINRPVLSNGVNLGHELIVSAGLLLSDGFLLSDGVMLMDGMTLGEGVMLMDGIVLSEGMLLGDGHLLCDGFVLGDGFLLSGGLLLSDRLAWGDGVMLMDGMTLGEGMLLGDGITLGEGMLLGDGHLLSDGVMLMDSITLAEGMLLGDGHLLGDGFLLTDGMLLGDGITLGEGMLLGDGHLLCDGVMLMD